MGSEEHKEMLFWTREEYKKFADEILFVAGLFRLLWLSVPYETWLEYEREKEQRKRAREQRRERRKRGNKHG